MKKILPHLIELLLICGGLSARLFAQEAAVGVTVPVTVTGGLIDSERTQADDPTAALLSGGFRLLVKPQIKLGQHFYFYSGIQVLSEPFFYQDRYSADRQIEIKMTQTFLGYTRLFEKASLAIKVGKLTSAFGAFPLRYDDDANFLLDQPLAYAYLKVRSDQLPCGVTDFISEPEPDVDFHCGGAETESYGVQPVTLYGLPGIQIEGSWKRLDARLQLTNSSPINPRNALASGQHPQWTAGGGYTMPQGFRFGMSAFEGPWLDNDTKPYLPPGSGIADYPASGLGADGQWARGSWNSVTGELQRVVFRYPHFSTSPASTFSYLDLKRIISPRWYAATRLNYQANNRPEDAEAQSATPFLANRQAFEFAIGFRPNRSQLLKAGYERTRIAGFPRTNDNVFGVQFVISINGLSKVIK